MVLPKINLNDGKHKLIVAEDGERVLTPEQNKDYEAQHPDARKKPMLAKIGGETAGLFDATADVEGAPEIPAQPLSPAATYPLVANPPTEAKKTEKKPFDNSLINNMGQDTFQVHETPMMSQLYDTGGKVQGTPSITDRIKSKAVDLYNQWQALKAPLDNEAQGLQERQRITNEGVTGTPQAPKPMPTIPATAPAPTDLVHPAGAAYGSRPGENPNLVTPDMLKPLGAPASLGKAYDCGGRVEVYDESGVVSTDDESDDHAKEAAYHQAASEVHAEEAEKHKGAPTGFGGPIIPNPKGIKVQADTDNPEPSKDVQMNNLPYYKGDSGMNTSNPEDAGIENPAMKERPYIPGGGPMRPTEDGAKAPVMSLASAKTPLGDTGAPRSTQMNRLPLQVPPEAPKPKPEPEPVAPDINAIIQKDKLAAAAKGAAGLTDLGTSLIHENVFMPKYTGPGAKKMEQGQAIPEEQLGKDEKAYAKQEASAGFKQKLQDYDRRIQASMDLGTPEGDREAASLGLAKQHFQKMNPYGSAANHPGLLGKVEHGLAKAGNIAGDIVAPGTMALIPGTDIHKGIVSGKLMGQEQEATKESLEQAQAGAAKAQPELAEEKIEAAEIKARMGDQQALFKGGAKRLDNGDVVPLTYEELPADSQAKIDLNNAKANYQDAFAEYRKYQADPNGPQAKALEEKMKSEAIRAGAAAGNLGLNKKKFMADYYGTDENGVALPGVERDEQGNPIGPKVAKGNETTSMRLNKADLSQNVQLNAKNAIDMITANPELFGKVAGRYTNTRQMAGSGDEAIKNLGIEVHNIAVASAGIHGQRGQAAVEAYEKDILNKFHDTPAATISGLNEISGSVQTFIDAAKSGKKVAPTPTAANEKPAAPAGATNEVLKDGKVIGHVVDGKYVALPKATK
jgi:hypothetical protein